VKDSEVPVLVAGDGWVGRRVAAAFPAPFRAFHIGRAQYDLRNEADAALSMLLARPAIVIDAVADLSDPGNAFRTTMAAGMNLVHASAAQQARFVHLAPAHLSALYPWESTSIILAHYHAKEALGRMCRAYEERHVQFDFAEVRLPRLYGPNSEWLDPITVAVAWTVKASRESEKELKLPFFKGDTFELLDVSTAAHAVARVATRALSTEEEQMAGRVFALAPNLTIGAAELACVVTEQLGFKGPITFCGRGKVDLYRGSGADLERQVVIRLTPRKPAEAVREAILAMGVAMPVAVDPVPAPPPPRDPKPEKEKKEKVAP